MKHLLYSLVDCPLPPQWLLERSLKMLEDQQQPTQVELLKWSQSYTDRTLIKDEKISSNAFNRALYLDQECLAWAKENISPDVIDMRIVSTEPGAYHKGPHIDITRRYTGMFVIETGGNDHQTCFYQSRLTSDMTGRPGDHIDNFDDVETVCCVKLPKKKWALINSYVFHGVENIPNGRIALQFSIDCVKNLSLSQQITVEKFL